MPRAEHGAAWRSTDQGGADHGGTAQAERIAGALAELARAEWIAGALAACMAQKSF